MPPGITLIGLGPGDSQLWTMAARRLLFEAPQVYLRTGSHPSVAELPGQIYSFDDWYEQVDEVEQANAKVAAEIVRVGQGQAGVIYATPGHPDIGEATVPLIRAQAQRQHLPVTTIPGLSFIEPTLTALGLAGPANLQVADAAQIAGRYHPPLEPDRPVLIAYVQSQKIASQVKRALLNAYPDDFTVTLIQAAGTKNERVWSCRLAELETQLQLDAWTILYLPADSRHSSFSAFQETIAHLRAPNGCPWDRVQTHQTLRPYLLEEAYEVLETLDANDPAALAEELGDLLLQIVLHTQIAIDQGEFKMGTVLDHINRKMLRRHPHVFGNVVIERLEDLAANWAAIKKDEKVQKGAPLPASALDGVPASLPALAQALAISKKAVRAGFEWPNLAGVLASVVEEAGEIAEAVDPVQVEAEVGDLLFSLVNLARWQKVDAESALRAANARFSRRFKQMERLAAEQGKNLVELSSAESEALWDETKVNMLKI